MTTVPVAPALGGVSFGQLDDFTSGSGVLGWTEGAATPNPPTVINSGGPNGVGDAYLSNTAAGGFGAGSHQVMFNQQQWTGDFVTAGVTRLEMKLANFGATPLSIRVAFSGGASFSRFSSTTAVELPAGSGWQKTVFNLTNSSLSSLGGADTVAQALGSVNEFRILSAASGPSYNGDGVLSVLGVDAIRALRQPGDASFDSVVNFDDLVTLAQNYNTAAGATWSKGDFTFDGAVGFDDLVILAQNYGAGASAVNAADVGGGAFGRDWARALSLVPEPGLVMASAGGLTIAGRRRRCGRLRQ